MKLNQKGLDIIISYEGFSSKPYLDPVGIPTIGYGTTVYPNGKKVTMQDALISKEVALVYKMDHIAKMEKILKSLIKVALSDNRYSAICSLVYNIGIGAFRTSTLLKVINEAPGAPGIRDEFMKWNKATDKSGRKIELPGLTKRRKAEADLYFTK